MSIYLQHAELNHLPLIILVSYARGNIELPTAHVEVEYHAHSIIVLPSFTSSMEREALRLSCQVAHPRVSSIE